MLKFEVPFFLAANSYAVAALWQRFRLAAVLFSWFVFWLVLLKSYHEAEGVWKIITENMLIAAALSAVALPFAVWYVRASSKSASLRLAAEDAPAAEEALPSKPSVWLTLAQDTLRPPTLREMSVLTAFLVVVAMVWWLSPASEKAREDALAVLESDIAAHRPNLPALASEVFPHVLGGLPKTQASDYDSVAADTRDAIARNKAAALQELTAGGIPEDLAAGVRQRLDVIAATAANGAGPAIARAAAEARAAAARRQLEATRSQIIADAARAVKDAEDGLLASAREKLATMPESTQASTARALAESIIAELERAARAALESSAQRLLGARAPEIQESAGQGALAEANATAKAAQSEMGRAIADARVAATQRKKKEDDDAIRDDIRKKWAAKDTPDDLYREFREQAKKYGFTLCENRNLSGTSLYIGTAIRSFEECARACVTAKQRGERECDGFDIQMNGATCSILHNARIQGAAQGMLAAVRGSC